MGKLTGLKPERVFHYFEELTKIPRCSYNELEVAKFIEQTAKDLGHKAVRDQYHNVIVEKEAQGCHQSGKTVILQAHTDMVCVAREGYEFDFSCSPIPIKVEGDWIMTEGTTLGADNGIGASMMLAILEDREMSHPNLTFLFTATEETGMDGVIGLEKGLVKGDMLVNIDSEEEGYLLTSCAGGVDHVAEFDAVLGGRGSNLKKISIGGLKGGHSGMEIVKGRANAIKLLARILGEIKELQLYDIKGGVKRNAIPQNAEAVVSGENVEEIARMMEAEFRNEYQINDGDLTVTVTDVSGEREAFTAASTSAILNYLRIAPHGVLGMSKSIDGLVETSLNMALIHVEDRKIVVQHSIRSSVKSLKYEAVDVLQRLTLLLGGRSTMSDGYPEWQYREESYLREHMKEVWKSMYGKELIVTAIHAGLECGYLVEKIGDIDMVSIGPDHFDVHTPDERVCISSVERVYRFLVKSLETIV